MQKIISLFKRNYETDHLVRNEVVPGAEWVINGEGVATKKYDGTCCLVKDGYFYKRFELKKGKAPPWNFTPANEPDAVTGKTQGWVPVNFGDPADKWHAEAWDNKRRASITIPDGTYELVGPNIQGNPQGFEQHTLIAHAEALEFEDCPRDFHGLKQFFKTFKEDNSFLEGIVWHHPDGRMVKIKAKDFGI